ncbi:hypothetical protein [Streptomyces sp. NPDC058595]|uniref:hypothetical protein n=1 Tax=Streptomyces sp. NPDC058595 TaxID=3346550 RepID=UPI00365C7216
MSRIALRSIVVLIVGLFEDHPDRRRTGMATPRLHCRYEGQLCLRGQVASNAT